MTAPRVFPLAISALLFAASAAAQDRPPPAGLSPEALAQRLARHDAPALILDTRTPEEFAAGRIPGARLLPHDRIAQALPELQAFRDREIVLYCRSGRRSALAEAVLREHGFSHLVQLEGSWQAWAAAGHVRERDASALQASQ